jgi:hypothetical protein
LRAISRLGVAAFPFPARSRLLQMSPMSVLHIERLMHPALPVVGKMIELRVF